jgi:hypothetical protein
LCSNSFYRSTAVYVLRLRRQMEWSPDTIDRMTLRVNSAEFLISA